MIEHSQDITNLAEALHAFQAEVRGVEKDSKNPHFKNRYASLEAVIEAARPGLQKHGIVFIQAPGQVVSGTLEVSTMLIHAKSGQWLRSTMQIPMAKVDPQGAGSAVTYAQRYSLMAALGIPPVEQLDDDANKAMETHYRKEVPKDTPPPSERTIANTLKLSLKSARNSVDLQKWFSENLTTIDGLPEALKDEVRSAYSEKLHSLRSAA